jgi:hypothetical protein
MNVKIYKYPSQEASYCSEEAVLHGKQCGEIHHLNLDKVQTGLHLKDSYNTNISI